jgi:ubiquitin C-terminal hydrolase
MWSQNCIISPGRFIKHLQLVSIEKNREEFSNFSQNDSSEFFLFIIDCFHTALSRNVNVEITGTPKNEKDKIAISCYHTVKELFHKEYSEIYELFYGIHVSQIISLEDEKILSSNPEPYFMINLSIPENNKSPNLYDCFDLYVNGENLEGENAWFNEKTNKKENIKKKISYWSFPNILVIDLKRFNPFNPNNKNRILVTFPIENLNLSKYVIGYKKESYIYDLYGIANHSGNTMGGHYTSFVKNANEKWYHFNDTIVTEIKNYSQLISPNAYCLFYRKKILS